MTTPASHHTATVLLDGRVLVAGGRNGTSFLNSAEIYNPATPEPGRHRKYGNRPFQPHGYTAPKRPGAGGRGQSGALAYTRTAEIFNPTTGIWQNAGVCPRDPEQTTQPCFYQTGRYWWPGEIWPKE